MTGTIHKLDRTGDSQVEWDVETGTGVDLAQELFTQALGEGYLAVEVRGEEKVQIHDFAPGAERIVLIPPMVGG